MIVVAIMITAEDLHQKLAGVKGPTGSCQFSLSRCEELAPIINEIVEIKEKKKAVILAHSYVAPEIVYGVADFKGDSYMLSKKAAGTEAEIIVFSAVRFMAETAKILSPEKKVYVPSQFNGCTLADSISGEDVRKLKTRYPDYIFVCYINTTAEVKAECHTCVTSSNVYRIVEKIPSDKIYFLPDRLMGENLIREMKERGINKDIELYDGTCYVHEQYNPRMIDALRVEYPGLKVISHPECSPEVAKRADYVGSTSQMMSYVKEDAGETYFLLTECGLTSRLEAEVPDKKFVGSCTQCRYMKSNTLLDILRVLKSPRPYDEVFLEESVRQRALESIERMFEYTEGTS